MDNTIRKNEHCIISQPACDVVFSSTRSCFIGYSFRGHANSLELEILRRILDDNRIEPVDAEGVTAPGQDAFCSKICSKIISSRFCIVLLNSDLVDGPMPNANVYMEYGLMLGFNKHVIPFQREEDSLPFNVAGLDTIKYDNHNFRDCAEKAIQQAIEITKQDRTDLIEIDQQVNLFILAKKALITPIDNQGDRTIYNIGAYLGFNLLNDFSGLRYIYFGNFTALRPESALWRLNTLNEILSGRQESLKARAKLGIADVEQLILIEEFLKKLQIWILVTSDEDKEKFEAELGIIPMLYKVSTFSLKDVERELAALPA